MLAQCGGVVSAYDIDLAIGIDRPTKTYLIEVATKCIGSIDYWESLTNRIHGSFSSRSTMRVLVDP